MNKLLLLDLDGTIREPKSGEKFISQPKDQKIIEGADKALAKYVAEGWIAVGATNQGGVAAGYKTPEACSAEQYYTLELFPELAAIFYCPDFEGNQIGKVISFKFSKFFRKIDREFVGLYRKPHGGMLLYAIEATMIPPINCLMVGDRPEDEEAAINAGIQFIWAHEWREDATLP